MLSSIFTLHQALKYHILTILTPAMLLDSYHLHLTKKCSNCSRITEVSVEEVDMQFLNGSALGEQGKTSSSSFTEGAAKVYVES